MRASLMRSSSRTKASWCSERTEVETRSVAASRAIRAREGRGEWRSGQIGARGKEAGGDSKARPTPHDLQGNGNRVDLRRARSLRAAPSTRTESRARGAGGLELVRARRRRRTEGSVRPGDSVTATRGARGIAGPVHPACLRGRAHSQASTHNRHRESPAPSLVSSAPSERSDRAPDPREQAIEIHWRASSRPMRKRWADLGTDGQLRSVQPEEDVGREERDPLVAVDEGVVHEEGLEEGRRHLREVGVVAGARTEQSALSRPGSRRPRVPPNVSTSLS